ncbi:thioether cross-link-forming SCIFF peptide maturase [Thermanaeromonas sp.]|uniref:thioether cross-link-forming SCIFF peptide maturase n=1 Tax=Thermanaeromonas sp. TaxID=2003697 RepID=UPI0026128161|nr:thioether cross-link-forming SCIFF peptide maturase [Thermanaeromonas sp.]
MPDLKGIDWQADLHLFTCNGLHLLLDVNSGALHVLDDVAKEVLNELMEGARDLSPSAEALKATGRWGEERVAEVLEELARCQEEGSLFTRDLAAGWYRPPEALLQGLCLHVSHDCNMRCLYCFAGGGSFGGQKNLMPLSVGKAAIDFLLTASGPRRRVEVDFFGGEPLLNFPVVRELVFYGRSKARDLGKEIRFTLTTNGLALNKEIGDFLNSEGISVILSLDGRPETNDRYRRTNRGQGSYHRVLPRIKYFLERRGYQDYWVRGTYTRDNLDFTDDVRHLVELGFRFISLEPVVAPPVYPYALRMEDINTIREEYRRLASFYLEARSKGRAFEFFHFNLELNGGPCLAKRLHGCGAGVSYLAVSPEGELYPCHQLVGQEDFRLGHVETGVTRKELQEEFRQAHVYNKPRCLRCWARFYCSGGCHAAALASTGTLREPDPVACAVQKARLEAALYVLARSRINFLPEAGSKACQVE